MLKVFNTLKCEACGKKPPIHNKRFCNLACMSMAVNKPPIECACERCGTKFFKKVYDPKRFCSKLCGIYATGDKWKGKNKKKNMIQTKSGKGRSEVYETFY